APGAPGGRATPTRLSVLRQLVRGNWHSEVCGRLHSALASRSGTAEQKGTLSGVPGFPHLRPTHRGVRRRARTGPPPGRPREQGTGVGHPTPAVARGPPGTGPAARAGQRLAAHRPVARPAAVLTRRGAPTHRQSTPVRASSPVAAATWTGRASHSAMVRAIGCSVSTSTNPNCPDWLHSRNHHTPSASSAKSKAPYASPASRR